MILDFQCSVCNNIHEKYVEASTQIIACPTCNSEAKRIISKMNFKLEGVSGDFPTAASRWADAHERAARISD